MEQFFRPVCVLMVGWLLATPAGLGAAEETSPVNRVASPVPSTGKPTSGAPPVDFFRALLAADSAGRQRMLTNVPPAHRRVLATGVRTYESLSPTERELRLRTMELRFHITGLLRLSPSARGPLLERIPPESRTAVQERLAYWDKLQPDVQKALLEQERLLRVVTVIPPAPPSPPGLAAASTTVPGPLNDAASRWQSLPESKRRQAEDAFNRVFELGQREVEKVIGPLPLSPPEREAIEESLEQFRRMSSEQRSLCIRNFKRFADLSGQERLAYLRGAEEWRKMSVEDRAAWRQMVKRVPQFPPMPPGLGQPPAPPGMPPGLPSGLETATNRQNFN